MTLQIDIGPYDPDTRTVLVTFSNGEIEHTRPVNACLTDGEYDADATAARVAEVGCGVAAKIDIGVITAAPPEEPVSPPVGD